MGFGRGRLGQVVKETLSEPMTTFLKQNPEAAQVQRRGSIK
jgi:hypothetical protein